MYVMLFFFNKLYMTELNIHKSLYLLHVNVTKHNLKISILKPKTYNLIYWTNLGASGFRNDQSNSEAASSSLATIVGKKLQILQIKYLGIYIKGVTRWKKTFVRDLIKDIVKDINILFIRDITPLPFNGCSTEAQPRKRRRKKRKNNRKRFFKQFYLLTDLKKRVGLCVNSFVIPKKDN